jgi:hypothetical protein
VIERGLADDVDLVLIAGDLFAHTRPSSETVARGRACMLNSWWIAAFPGVAILRPHARDRPDGRRALRGWLDRT